MLAKTLRDQMALANKYLAPPPIEQATGLAAQVYRQMEAEFLPVPPVTLHAPVPELLAGAWSLVRETLRSGQVDRAQKEAVATAVSQMNRCPYCRDVHSAMLGAASDHATARALLQEDTCALGDLRMRWLVEHVRDPLHATRSPTPRPSFAASDIAEIIGTATTFHYINRMVNVFLEPTPFRVPAPLRPIARRIFGATAGSVFATRASAPGRSLALVPRAPLPPDLSWAAANPTVAAAFAGFAAVVEPASAAVLSEDVRATVGAAISAWDGAPVGLSRTWVERPLEALREADRPAARLALLTALASYQVDASIVAAFRQQHTEDAQLIAATAWASFTAARKASGWYAHLAQSAGEG